MKPIKSYIYRIALTQQAVIIVFQTYVYKTLQRSVIQYEDFQLLLELICYFLNKIYLLEISTLF